MPIYEYQCQDCDHRVEVLQKIADAPRVDCPACDKPSLRKVVSAVAFRLKGSGWYETDFKTGNKRNLAGDAKSDKPNSDKKDKPKQAESTKKADSAKSSTA